VFTFFILTIHLGTNAQEVDEVPFGTVEHVPVYPGCEHLKENVDLKNCMSDKVARFVSKKIKKRVLSSNLSNGKKRIFVGFKINTSGEIIDIQVRGPSRTAEREAKRVINLLPKMVSPGIVEGQPVIVPYSLPIIFEVKNKRN